MKIILINSPLFREGNRYYNEDSLPPIGLGYIATHLQNIDVDVELIDAVDRKISLNDLKEILNSLKPEFFATNIFTTNYDLVKELVETLTFSTHVIIGGLSTKELYKKIINWETQNPIDIVIGDGELITADIVKEDIKENAMYSKKNRRVFNVDGDSVYFFKNISDVPLNRNFFQNEPIKHPPGFREVNIVSSRGCIYNCTFCAAARSQNNAYPVRERSVSSIINELNEINFLYPETNSIRVLDDLFLKTKASLSNAVDIFSRFNFQWRSMAHVRTFNQVEQDEIEALKESGCKELFIGIESGSPRILKSINKTSNKDLILKNLTKLFKAKINVKGYFIYGFPDETKVDFDMTYNLACELKKLSLKYGSNFRTSVFQFRPYHGTEIFLNLKEKYPNLNFEHVTHNKVLSNLIGRDQFNFHSINYSDVCLKTIHDYICKTNNLNGSGIFFKRSPMFNRHKQKEKV